MNGNNQEKECATSLRIMYAKEGSNLCFFKKYSKNLLILSFLI